jgi:hypothetical protein
MDGSADGMTKKAIKEAFADVESDQFAARIGVASKFTTLVKGLKEELSIQVLLDLKTAEEVGLISERLRGLCGKEIDRRYANPWDFAITGYLWILWVKDFELAKAAADMVARTQNLWWGKFLADYLINLEANRVPQIPGRRPENACSVDAGHHQVNETLG